MTIIAKSAAHSQAPEHSSVAQHTAASNQPGDAEELRGNVTAAVTARADFPPAPTDPGNGSLRLQGVIVNHDDERAKTFITECSRNIEGLRSDREIKEAWGLDDGE